MSKKILRGGIFKHGVLEPLDIKLEGLDSLFHRSGLFIQIHLGVVCLTDLPNNEYPDILGNQKIATKCIKVLC